ncbi:long-chain-fatty-acid--CoA ligase [Micromonospora sp. LOL_013]|uniref:long-chain-fatty-acid--CoA ligase n=1 Tax=unclassified Micromonospora TaxID=2617518 RepID=UPI003A8C36BC
MSAYHPQLQTLQDVVSFHAAARPDHPAVRCEDRRITYRELDEASSRIARAVRAAGLPPGARLAYLGKESEHYYEILFAAAKSGTVLVPINWRLAPGEVSHILTDSRTGILFVEDEFAEQAARVTAELEPAPLTVRLDGPGGRGAGLRAFAVGGTGSAAVDVSTAGVGEDLGGGGPEIPVAQLYTSGTTGLPKGVVLAQRSFFAVRDALAGAGLNWIDWRDDDVALIGIPGFHIGGLWWATQGFAAGATLVALRMFVSSDAITAIERHRVTTACVVPAMLQMMLSEPGLDVSRLASLRKVVYGGSPISETLLKQCVDEIGCDFAQIYGLTETGNTAVCLPPEAHVGADPRPRAAGRPYPGIEVKVIDGAGRPLPTGEIGEICLRTPARMVEYWQLPEATARTLVDGWIHTGDAGYVDPDGFIYICDRIKDTIIVAGENVYPAEVESALARHPAVLEAAVVGVPHEQWGEAVHAFVVFRPELHAKPRELMLFLRGEIGSFKIPTSYEEIDVLPRNPSGKILRRALRDRFWSDMARQVN